VIILLIDQHGPALWSTLAWTFGVCAIPYGIFWLTFVYPDKRKKNKARELQEASDEKAFWIFWEKREAISKKFDPEHKWDETTTLPEEYEQECRKLNDEYRDVLKRRNG